ncbi:hypothetical protein [Lysobacter enzymogenes]|jgi:hypothetical protein|uniref:hypothetical protein n=1 Tax=Lysobacter enzymogenes TaxID=69 RepID=UPI000894E2A0|nr:hypothetical protein [Lysobacter enzymogenes]SDW51779.1 hypothetical protein SAMN05421681_10295 [Lysobacter enzymogenes]
MSVDDLYMQSFAWRRIGSQACVRYVILMNVASGRFAVHSADFFNSNEQIGVEYFNRQFVELMLEDSPLERCSWHDSTIAAIEAHDAEFSNEWG